MASGEMSREEFVVFLIASIEALKPSLADGAMLFVCMDWRHAGELLEAAVQQQLEYKNLCVWVKSNAGMGSFYRSQHELVFVFKFGQGPHQNNFGLGKHGRSRSNVWQYRGVNVFGRDRTELMGMHPTVKPVAMIADALRDVSRREEIVLDTFLGSGSSLIAAEDVGRICIGSEIDPAYVDVAIRRWQKQTGRDAVNAATGETFSAVGDRTAVLTPAATLVKPPITAAPSGGEEARHD
jgi:DNA modification methylase